MNPLSKVFVISKQFSKTPGSRVRSEGKFSGQELRENYLLPFVISALSENVSFTIDLDGAAGYGTSFLEEAFGGLVRINKIPLKDLLKYMTIKSDEMPMFKELVDSYIKRADHV